MLLNCGVGEDSWESLGLQGVHPKGNKSWIFIGRTDAEAETPILWPPDDSLENESLENLSLILGKIEGGRRRGWQRMRWLDSITDSMDMSLGRLRELVMNREAWQSAVHGIAKSLTWLSDWTELLLKQHIKKQRHYFTDQGLLSPRCGFSSSHIWMWVGP